MCDPCSSASPSSRSPATLREGGLLDASYDVVDRLPRLTETLAEQVADAQLRCTDFVEDSTQAQLEAHHGDLDQAAYSACLGRAMGPPEQKAALVASLTGEWEDPALAALSEAQADCAEAQDVGR